MEHGGSWPRDLYEGARTVVTRSKRYREQGSMCRNSALSSRHERGVSVARGDTRPERYGKIKKERGERRYKEGGMTKGTVVGS